MRLDEYIRKRLEIKPICLMTHVIFGYPSIEANWKALEIMAEHQVDLVEIQMPFSEPTADGPVFAHANQKALEHGATVRHYFEFMDKVTSHFNFPVLMMGYYNMAFKMGEERFLQQLKNAGGSGFIIPDLPVEAGAPLYRRAGQMELSPIAFMTPTSPAERLAQNGRAGSGFIYVVARKGVTGAHTHFDTEFQAYIRRCRKATNLPLAIGFGISQPEDLACLVGKVEMAIIGTALLKTWERGGERALRQFFRSIRLR